MHLNLKETPSISQSKKKKKRKEERKGVFKRFLKTYTGEDIKMGSKTGRRPHEMFKGEEKHVGISAL